MILLSKLEGTPVLVNLEAVKYAEATPDTRVHFLNGDMIIVRESLEDLQRLAVELKQRIVHEARRQGSPTS